MRNSKMIKQLVLLLKSTELNQDAIIGTTFMLHKSEEAMKMLGIYIVDNNPTPTEIIEKAIEIHNNLPKELQTGE